MAVFSRNMYRVGRRSKLLQPRSIPQSREGFRAIQLCLGKKPTNRHSDCVLYAQNSSEFFKSFRERL